MIRIDCNSSEYLFLFIIILLHVFFNIIEHIYIYCVLYTQIKMDKYIIRMCSHIDMQFAIFLFYSKNKFMKSIL